MPRPGKPKFEDHEPEKPVTHETVLDDLKRWPREELGKLVADLAAFLEKEPRVRPFDRGNQVPNLRPHRVPDPPVAGPGGRVPDGLPGVRDEEG